MRWWLVDGFSAAPTGMRVRVSGERFTTVMRRFALQLQVEVEDRLGPGPTRTFELAFSRPRDFRVGDVIRSHPLLCSLADLAGRRDLDPDQLRTQIEGRVGRGFLVDLMSSLAQDSPPQRPPIDAGAPTGNASPGGGSLDAIFGRASVPGQRGATESPQEESVVSQVKSGLDALVGAMLDAQGSSSTRRASDPSAAIMPVLEAVATDLLSSAEVAPLERAWRGLRMLVAAAPEPRHLDLEVLDAGSDWLVRLDASWPTASAERPDLVIVGRALRDLDEVQALGQWAAARRVFVLAELDPAAEERPLPGQGQAGSDEVPEGWQSLRAAEGAAWVGLVSNEVVLANEPTALGPRRVFGSPPVAFAALVASQFDPGRGWGPVVGPRHAHVAPAAHDVELRPGEQRTIPTRTFAPWSVQEQAATWGEMLLGSEAGTDRMLVSAAITLDGTELVPRLVERARSRTGS